MNLSTILMAGQTIASGIQAAQGGKTAKKIGKYQKEMAKDDYLYNKGQLADYYNKSINSIFGQYAQSRAQQAGEYTKINSELNTQLSAQGVNLADSSVADDMNNQLNFEYENSMQNMLTNQINDISNLIANVGNQEYQIQKGYNDAIYGIDQAVNQVSQQAWDKFAQNASKTLISAADGFSAIKSKNPKASFGENLGTYFSTFSWGDD